MPRHVALRGMGASLGCRNQQSFPHPVLATDSVRFVRSEGKKRSKAVSATEKKTEMWWTLIFSTTVCVCMCAVFRWREVHTKQKTGNTISFRTVQAVEIEFYICN